MDAVRSKTDSAIAIIPSILPDERMLELLPVAACVCDAGGFVLRYNRRASEIWGRSPRLDGPGLRFCGAQRLFRADGRPLAPDETPMAEVLRTARPLHDIELLVEQPGGARRAILVNIEPVMDGTGALAGTVNCFQDITRHRTTAPSRSQEWEPFRTIIDATPECVKIVARDGRLLYMNAAGLRMIEADDADVPPGTSVFDLIAPEHRGDWEARHARVCGGEKLTWEFDVVGLRGTRLHMETHAVPLPMSDGTVAHLAVTRDVTQRRRSEALLRERERYLRTLLEALPAAVYTTDAAGRITFHNQAAVELWGRGPEPADERWCGSWRLYRPDGTPLPHDQCPMAMAIKEGRPLRHEEAMAERPDGSRIPFIAYPTPLHDAAGTLVGAVNMLVDISQRKEAEERRQLLLNELNHRVKNTLATVQSIAAQSFRAETERESRRWFEGRLEALSNAHDVLTRESWEGAGLREILERAVAPFQDRNENRLALDGPDLRLTPRMALSLSLAVHELCINAAKYGALSGMGGRVAIGWRVVGADAGSRLRLTWTERGGPPVEPPRRRGFGSRLLERGLVHELEADVRLDYAPAGLACAIDAPLPAPTCHPAARAGAA